MHLHGTLSILCNYLFGETESIVWASFLRIAPAPGSELLKWGDHHLRGNLSFAYPSSVIALLIVLLSPSLYDKLFRHPVYMGSTHINLVHYLDSLETIIMLPKFPKSGKVKVQCISILEWRTWDLNARLFAYIESHCFGLHYEIYALRRLKYCTE